MSSSAHAPSALGAAADFERLFDDAPCGLLTSSPDGRIARVNATFARWMGLTREDFSARPFRELLTVPGRIFYETNISPMLRLQGGFEEVALEVVTSAGDKIPMLVNAKEHRDDAGLLLFVQYAMVRASKRRNFEHDLKGREAIAVQRLQDEKATADLREQFIAVLGHDLRNPLASIVGAGRLLRREVQSEKGVRVLQLMDSSVDRMAGLIDDVMDFARGRLGSGIDVHRKVAPLEPILRQVVEELETSEPSRVIRCEFDLPHPISFDASRIGQLVSNLLANALTHGDPKQPVDLHAATDGQQLELWVANAGRPISSAAMARLFQPFFRGEVRASQHGLGLGLHIAAEIARAHAGTLEVRSDAEETRFTLRIPLDGAPQNPPVGSPRLS